MNEIKVKVEIENLEELKNLSKKLNEQAHEMSQTINEIGRIDLSSRLSINQQDR